jgi:hypothetical protein
MQELEDMFRLQQIPQPVLPEILESGICGETGADQLLDRLRDENLATMADGQQSRQAIERGGEVVATVIRNRFPGVQRHADPQWIWCAPVLAEQRLLSGQGRGHGVRGGGEGGLHGIPDGLEMDPIVGANRLAEQHQVTIDSGRHGRTIAFPSPRRPLDIGKEEGDGTVRQLGHDPSPTADRGQGSVGDCRTRVASLSD